MKRGKMIRCKLCGGTWIEPGRATGLPRHVESVLERADILEKSEGRYAAWLSLARAVRAWRKRAAIERRTEGGE